MTEAPLARRALCRGLLSRAVDAVASPAGALAETEDRTDRTAAPAGPDYFASFDQCHTLIAEMRPFLGDAIRDLGIDPRGKSDVELAREIMAHACATPAPQRTDAADAPPAPAPVEPGRTAGGPVGDL